MTRQAVYPLVSALGALSLAWVAGMAVGLWVFLPPAVLLVSIPLFVIGAVRRRHRAFLYLGLGLLLFLAGALRSGELAQVRDELAPYVKAGRPVTLRVQVAAAEPWVQGWRLRASAYQVAEAHQIAEGGGWQPLSGPVLLYFPPTLDYSPGDRLEVSGKLETPPHRGTTAMFYPKVRMLGAGSGDAERAIHRLRQSLSQGLARSLPEPQAALAQALLLGQRGNLPQSLKQDFTRTGTAHLLAISGLNISMMAGMVLALAAWALGRHRPYYLLLTLFTLWLYVLLSGSQPPAVRAGIMASLFLWGEWLGRPRAGLTALTFAAAVMLGVSPGLLRDVSFQLSFAAMAGLIVLSPPLQAAGGYLRLPRVVGDSLAYTVGATLAALPLVSHYFDMVPLVGVPATLLALPAMPGAILASAAAGGLALAALPLALPAAAVAWLFLFYTVMAVRAFAVLPGGFIPFSLSAAGVWGCYLALLLLATAGPKAPALAAAARRRLKTAAGLYQRLPPRPLAAGLLLAAGVVWAGFLSLPSERLEVSFLNVGPGLAILVQQGNRQVLIDGGPYPGAIATALGKRLPFWDRTIDGIVLTHPDADHLTGLSEVLRRYRVKWALESAVAEESEVSVDTLAYREWRRRLQQEGITPTNAPAGMQIRLEDATFTVLHPPPSPLKGTEEDVDNNGLVLRLEVGKVSFLFTGDLRWEGESELMARGAPLRSTVLQAGHHGSATSTSPSFLAAVAPRVAVVSSSAGVPNAQVVERLKTAVGQEVYVTGQKVTITFATDGQRLWVRTER